MLACGCREPERDAPAATQQLDNFLRYVFNIQRIGFGCLLNADILDPDFRRLEELIKDHKRNFYKNLSAQFEAARKRFSLIGHLETTIISELRRDCDI